MKSLVSFVLLAIAIMLFSFSTSASAIASDLKSGATVFSANCAACHVGGGNVVNSSKTLKKDMLERYAMASLEAIATQVTNGKAAMPGFKGRLTEQQINDVAAYVLDQAEKGW